MQCLVDLVGALRVAAAAAAAAAARLFVHDPGRLHRLAGAQANLIDDVSGQIPPYDQFITLGPVKVKETVEAVEVGSGLPCAVVDVNTSVNAGLTSSPGQERRRRRGRYCRVALLGNPQMETARNRPRSC